MCRVPVVTTSALAFVSESGGLACVINRDGEVHEDLCGSVTRCGNTALHPPTLGRTNQVKKNGSGKVDVRAV